MIFAATFSEMENPKIIIYARNWLLVIFFESHDKSPKSWGVCVCSCVCSLPSPALMAGVMQTVEYHQQVKQFLVNTERLKNMYLLCRQVIYKWLAIDRSWNLSWFYIWNDGFTLKHLSSVTSHSWWKLAFLIIMPKISILAKQ